MLHKIRSFLETPYYSLLVFAVGMFGVISGETILTLKILAVLIEILLFLSDDIMPATFPFFMLIAVGAALAKDFSVLLPYWPWVVPAVIGTVFHFTVYRKPFRAGSSFWPLIATAVALILGGVGCIPREEYFSPLSLIYIAALGVGLVGMYYLYATEYKAQKNYDVVSNLLFSMLLTGIVCSLYLILPILRNIPQLTDRVFVLSYFGNVDYRNSMATYLIMLIPAPFYFAGKQTLPRGGRILSFLLGFLMYIALVFSISRTALLFGTLEWILCLIFYFYGRTDWKTKGINLAILMVLVIVGVWVCRTALSGLWGKKMEWRGGFFRDSSRVAMISRSFSDFLKNPLFGIGIGAIGDGEFLPPRPGCLPWYHSYFPQIWGSMGLVGIAAYGYQLVVRIKLMLFRPNRQTVALSLSYLGLFLYSQTDPGEFEPVPFALLALLIFILLETHRETIRADVSELDEKNPV